MGRPHRGSGIWCYRLFRGRLDSCGSGSIRQADHSLQSGLTLNTRERLDIFFKQRPNALFGETAHLVPADSLTSLGFDGRNDGVATGVQQQELRLTRGVVKGFNAKIAFLKKEISSPRGRP